MAIVDSTALATMVSNSLVFYDLMRRAGDGRSGRSGRRMLIRRLSAIRYDPDSRTRLGCSFPAQGRSPPSASSPLPPWRSSPHLILAATGKGRDSLAARASLSVSWRFGSTPLPPVVPAAWLDAPARFAIDPLSAPARMAAPRRSHGVASGASAPIDCLYRAVHARKVQTPPLPRCPRAAADHQPRRSCAALWASSARNERARRPFQAPIAAIRWTGEQHSAPAELIAQIVERLLGTRVSPRRSRAASSALLPSTRLLDEGGRACAFAPTARRDLHRRRRNQRR